MRPIRTDGLAAKIDAAWLKSAKTAKEAVKDFNDPKARAKAINARSSVWSDIKEVLRKHSHGKCWYCESINDGSDNAVDHFRPKNRVAEAESHGGYWWLAFDWTNYRYCCSFCNSIHRTSADPDAEGTGGKQDHFPLFNEPERVTCEDEPLLRERPKLLDPTSASDVRLLSFDADGKAAPAISKAEDPKAHERAVKTIEILNLDQHKVLERRALYMVKARHDVQLVKQRLAAGQSADDLINSLFDRKAPDAEYSRAVEIAIRSEDPDLIP